MYLLCALVLSGAARQTAASTIAFDNVAGHYLAQVQASIQTRATTTTYQGYDNNYGPSSSPIPTSAPPSLGLANDYASVAEADFAIAVQFNQAGTVSFSMHELGSVSAAATNPPNDYAFARMQTSVAIVDNSAVNNTGRSSAGALLCISRNNGTCGLLCSTPLSVNQDFVATLDVLPGHVYTLSAAEWGDESSYGIDPATMSLQLSDGLSIVPVPGQTPRLSGRFVPIYRPRTRANRNVPRRSRSTRWTRHLAAVSRPAPGRTNRKDRTPANASKPMAQPAKAFRSDGSKSVAGLGFQRHASTGICQRPRKK